MKQLRSVLIVDDSPGDVEIANYYLEAEKACDVVLTASDGLEAFELLTEKPPAPDIPDGAIPPTVIILDINMPRMGGFEFLDVYAEYLKGGHEAPALVVMLSSSEYGPDVENAKRCPLVKKYFVKPFTTAHARELADEYGVERS